MKQMVDFYAGYYTKYRKDLFEKLVKLFNLDANKRISQFSKGMQKQAFIIFALCSSVDFIILDETFDGLDPAIRMTMQKLFKAAVSKKELGIIISGHNLKDIRQFCNNIGLLNNNKLIYNGGAESLSEDEIMGVVNAGVVQDFSGLF